MKSHLGEEEGSATLTLSPVTAVLITARGSRVCIFAIFLSVNVFVLMMLPPFLMDSLPLVVVWKTYCKSYLYSNTATFVFNEVTCSACAKGATDE